MSIILAIEFQRKIELIASASDESIDGFPFIRNSLWQRRYFAREFLATTDPNIMQVCIDGMQMINEEIKKVIVIL